MGHADIVTVLVKAGANVNNQESQVRLLSSSFVALLHRLHEVLSVARLLYCIVLRSLYVSSGIVLLPYLRKSSKRSTIHSACKISRRYITILRVL
jgi:hypothetical protein